MSEPPFRPREKLIEKQKYYQSIHKHTYLKGPFDKVTSVVIPLALATTSLFLINAFQTQKFIPIMQTIHSFKFYNVCFVIAVIALIYSLVLFFIQGRGIYNMAYGIGKKE